MVLQERIELSTSPLPRECSTTELLQHLRLAAQETSGFLPQQAGQGKAGEAAQKRSRPFPGLRPAPRLNADRSIDGFGENDDDMA